MKTEPKTAKAKKRELKRKLLEAIAGQAGGYYRANDAISKAATSHMMGSGVVLTITALGGQPIIEPVLIRDGLSDDTIDAIKADLKKSYDLATLCKL